MQLVWHRADLRTHDHPALASAASAGPLLGIVVLDPEELEATSLRRRALLLDNVRALRTSYARLGGTLLVRNGHAARVLAQLCRTLPVVAVQALRSHTPRGARCDDAVEGAVPIRWHEGRHVRPPGSVRTRDGRRYRVYGAYFRAWRGGPAPEPLDAPARIHSPPVDYVEAGSIPDMESDVPLPPAGEESALAALREFIEERVGGYAEQRDRLDGVNSSRLSICFATGALSVRTAAAALWERPGAGPQKWLAELAWRDFLADLLDERPELVEHAFQARWDEFAWSDDDAAFAAWREGRTGIPVIDAAMRELRATGWISNRARMLAAQFLTKQLRVDWRRGERVFRDWLLDAELASNVGNWQWSAGLGVDNAPYFRVFNPVTQGKQHDPTGAWLRRWVPESHGDPRPLPHAIVDLGTARREYMAAAEEIQ